ncbi:hypothetical protein DGG96_02965 [Legionella qingyii]|uniref:Uncharacterized protein n=1 Tax=Legionella qingyii TaxID=2184757 RepID=A0A317U6E4_9GAMM|nr:hypothetical protein [Legionella qingyii]PWY56357.1 hypothetical protein DGG96_06225 [Legionella qingyii]PWY57287.1 hypothetical protein DGG96_02965 [Legionella qingyii]RUR24873.1 hypothetical protein ELY20_03720 [Legionella qingyii]
MSRLTKIHKKVLANFNDYVSDTNQFQLLAENIKLFEQIPARYLKKLYNNMSAFDYAKNNDALLVIAYSYIHYSYENKENTTLENSLIMLDKANDCFQKIIHSHTLLHPSHLNEIHSGHILKANFQLHKIKLLKAEMRLFYIEKEEKNNMPNAALIRKELTNIIDEYTNFKGILESKYKDRTLRAQLSINNNLLDSIETGLELANDLLKKLPQQAPKRRFSETISESNSAEQKSTQDTPKRKKMKRAEVNNSTSTQVSSTQSQQINLDNGNSRSEWDDLAALTAVVADTGPMEVHKPHEIIFPYMPQPSLPRFVEDSKTFLNKFQEWSKVYFALHSNYSKQQINDKSLEKIAHSLLLAAVGLKKESAIFKDEQFNPVAQVAVQFLLFICGIGTQSELEALKKQSLLANTYSPLLKPFIRSFLHVPPEKFISHLRMQFASEAPSNISFRGLEIHEIVEKLFKHFETVLPADDYEKVTEFFVDGLVQAHDKLVEQNAAEFHFTV